MKQLTRLDIICAEHDLIGSAINVLEYEFYNNIESNGYKTKESLYAYIAGVRKMADAIRELLKGEFGDYEDD